MVFSPQIRHGAQPKLLCGDAIEETVSWGDIKVIEDIVKGGADPRQILKVQYSKNVFCVQLRMLYLGM